MKKAEFIKAYTEIAERRLKARVKCGEMRVSEAIMSQLEMPKTAESLWRKHRSTWKDCTLGKFIDMMNAPSLPEKTPHEKKESATTGPADAGAGI